MPKIISVFALEVSSVIVLAILLPHILAWNTNTNIVVGNYLAFAQQQHKKPTGASIEADKLVSKGYYLNRANNRTGAIAYYDKALAIDPNNTNALLNKGVALGQLGKGEEAIFYIDKVLQIEPDATDALFDKGMALLQLGKYQDAITQFDKVLEKNPNDQFALAYKQQAQDKLKK